MDARRPAYGVGNGVSGAGGCTATVPDSGSDGDGPVDNGSFRAAMARLASGVSIVTGNDAHGRPHGFTASSFVSASLDPPLVVVSLAKSAHSHAVFASCAGFAVSILAEHHVELAHRFSRKDVDKFAGGPFRLTAGGMYVVDGALAVIECTVHARVDVGDHTLIIGRVQHTSVGDGVPAVYVDRRFHRAVPLDDEADPG